MAQLCKMFCPGDLRSTLENEDSDDDEEPEEAEEAEEAID